MRLLSEWFVQQFPGRILNIHPSLLPAFRGLEAQEQAVAYGEEPQRAKKEFSALRQEFSAKGERAYWLSRQKSLAATAWTDPFDIAVVEARLGESDAMFANLDKAYQQRSAALLYWEQTQPAFDRFRTDSRFQNFTRHAGLVQ